MRFAPVIVICIVAVMAMFGCASTVPKCYDYGDEIDGLKIRIETIEARQAADKKWQDAIVSGDIKIIGVDMK
jgi:hypothetical protein